MLMTSGKLPLINCVECNDKSVFEITPSRTPIGDRIQ